MTEHIRLQRIRDIGFRLQELQLIRVQAGASYAASTLNFLFQLYRLPKPTGLSLEQALHLLGKAVIVRHQLPYASLSVDGVLQFFNQRFQVGHSAIKHPTYRPRARTSVGQVQI
jgi:hypothetical protein